MFVSEISLGSCWLQKPEAVRDDMFHQVRNLAQPLVMVIPMLYAGMLLGGVPYLEDNLNN